MVKLIALLLIGILFGFAQTIPVPQIDFNPKKYICYRTEKRLQIDGKLNEAAWKKVPWTDNFVDIEGPVKPPPRFRTRAKMLWDDSYFYVGAEVDEPDIWATLKNRDDIIFYDNDFEVFVDPDGDTREYAEFEMNALNTVWDLLLVMPYRDIDHAAVHGWDIKGLKSAVHINGTLNNPDNRDSSWIVEIAFPFTAYKEIAKVSIPPLDGDQWRVNFSRVEWKTEVKNGKYQKIINSETNKPFPEDNWVWSPQGVVNMHYPEMWGYIQFSSHTAGSGTASFKEHHSEAAKWFLRQIYYQEKNYFNQNGNYTKNLSQLKINFTPLKGFSSPPVIETTSALYEAYLQADNAQTRIHINNTGFTWVSKIKK